MKRVLMVLALALGLGAPAPALAQTTEGVAAVVNDTVISTWDVRQRAAFLLLSAQIEPTPDGVQRMAPQALRSLVDEILQIQEARNRFQVEVTDAEVDEQLAAIARANNQTTQAYVQTLAQLGVNASTLRQQLRAEIVWRRVIGGFYGSRIRISQDQITDALERLQANAVQTQFLVSEIFLPASNPTELQEVEAGAMQLLQEMQRGAPFYLVARQFSASPSAAAGGDLGWLAAGQLRPEIRAATEGLQQGQVSMPIVTPGGVYIVALRGRRDGATPTARYSLRQVILQGEGAQDALERARSGFRDCGRLEADAARVQGASVIDLGEVDETELSEEVRARLSGVAPGQTTPAFAVGTGAGVLMVCAREVAMRGVELPSREEVEDELFQAQLGMLAQRYLNNLRREATILTRNVGTPQT